MTPQEFVQKWLPNYESRLEIVNDLIIKWYEFNPLPDNIKVYELVLSLHRDRWTLQQFQEAIEAFAKAQREICAEKCKDEVDDFMYYEILNAPMP